MPSKKYPKLRGRTQKLASKYISEEMRTKKYPRKQAIAIGISRARAAAGKTKRGKKISAIMKRYR